jgi:hypothetical protein
MKPADKAKANRYCDMKEKIKNTMASKQKLWLGMPKNPSRPADDAGIPSVR